VTESGAAALQLLQKMEVNLVMTDLEMPDMDGYALMKELKSIQPTMKVVAFSAAVSEKNREELLHQGFDEVLCKPFRTKDLENCVERTLFSIR
jgi:CheY-like chemotaxis protein